MRFTLVYVAIYALVCRLSSAANTPYNLPIKFPDGVLVSGGQDTRRQSATWSLLVVLDAPKIVDWLSPVHRIRSVMATLLAVYRATNSTRDSWVQRLHVINSPSSVRTRSPPSTEDELRALFDLGGDILSKLFGTATNGNGTSSCRMSPLGRKGAYK